MRNAKEIPDIIIDHCSGKKELVSPILGIYTDGGPEHRSNFLSVQIAYIALQQFLDLDMLVAARTVSWSLVSKSTVESQLHTKPCILWYRMHVKRNP